MIIKAMILECYEAFKEGRLKHVPQDMKPTSAKMTMNWLESILNTREPYNRSGSLLQYKIILEKIEKEFGPQRAREAALVLMPYCQKYNKQSHISILQRF
ncbi:hypothetical protein [Methylomicrobium album]|uniref:Uncharacterized protein n=1 Tax=Methylomicrobium album BG8 TaxID=686340 RepID=H8GK84_METAL|nr:hypothetical protein [Methylomicrobium album]EIC29208.1 hypothetical protein Metal_1423 [Methylomicrobium album BG8]